MSEPTTVPADHGVKVTHVVFGLLFLGISGVWALVTGGVITADRLTYVGPGVLIAAGLIGLAASLASTRNRPDQLGRQADHILSETGLDDPTQETP